MPTGKLTTKIIEAAIAGFEAQKKSIDAEIAELRGMLTAAPEGSAEQAPAKQKRRKFSAAAIKRMREAQEAAVGQDQGQVQSRPRGDAGKDGQAQTTFQCSGPKGALRCHEEALGCQEGGRRASCNCGEEGCAHEGGLARYCGVALRVTWSRAATFCESVEQCPKRSSTTHS